jgi:hypothetical protein
MIVLARCCKSGLESEASSGSTVRMADRREFFRRKSVHSVAKGKSPPQSPVRHLATLGTGATVLETHFSPLVQQVA